jgi:TRAP-type C4-dicarboxylate transport system permease small subunit
VLRLLDILARSFAFAGGAILTGVTGMSVVSVIGRTLFGTPVPGDFELVQVGSAAAIAAFLPYCQLRNGNIIVDFFTVRASRRVQDGLDAFGAVVLAAVMGLLAWRTIAGVITVKASHEITMIVGFPVWIGYAAIVPSLVLATVVGLVTAVQCARGTRA